MASLKNIALNLGEIAFGFILALASSKLCMVILNFLWSGSLGQHSKNGFLSAIFLLLSLLFLCICIIIAASEWIPIFKWHRGGFLRSDAYQGAFLGISAAMLILLTSEWIVNGDPAGGIPKAIGIILFPIAKLTQLITSLISASVFMLIFAPLGAFLACKFSNRRLRIF